MSRREAKKAATRRAIREAAARLFAERGYADTTTREIAEAAGIATGTLFNYAPTKRDVVRLVWKGRAEEVLAAGLTAAAQAPDDVAACVEIVRPIFAFYAEDLELGRIFLDAAIYADRDDPEIQVLNARFVGAISARLAPRVGVGATAAGLSVFGAYYLVLTMLLGGQLATPEQAVSTFRDLVRQQAAGWG